MKILVTTSVFPRWPGDATPPFIYNLCRDLTDAGCKITVLAPHSPSSRFSEVRDGIRIVRFPYCWPLKYQSLSYEGGMVVRLRETPSRILQLPFLCAAQYAAIQKLLLEEFDLIHAHSLLPQGWIAGLANSRGLPLVTSSHGADVFLLKEKWQPILRQAVANSTTLIANSNATAHRLFQLGASPAQVHLIPATPNYPDPDEPTHVPPHTPTLLFAGRVIPEKGPDALIEAMPEILRDFPDCKLRIAGSGAMEAQLKQRVKELGLERSITFLGWLPPDRLRNEMQNSTLLIAPSRMIEGQNLVVTEALSVGCPVATTPRGGVLDLVKDGETGLVIPDANRKFIVQAVLNILPDPDELSKISRNGFSHFTRNYSRKRITKSTMRLYRDCRYYN
jgi:phosphatidylinositol alpha-1,6-mannosyltransferase